MNKKISKSINYLKKKKYHLEHKKEAEKALRTIKSNHLNDKIIKKCDEYAIEVLGSKVYAPWLYVYSAINNEFKEGWIPDNYYGEIVVPKLKGGYGKISHYRALNGKLLSQNLLPDAFYFTNGVWINKESKVIDINKEINTKCKYIFKSDESSQGRGIEIIQDHKEIKEIKENGVLQSYINQNNFFNDIMPSSVATIRLTTYLHEDGSVSTVAGYLRTSRENEKYVKSATGLRLAFDTATGELYDSFFDSNWKKYEKHPDSKFSPKGKKIPNYLKIKKIINEEHKKIPFARIIGWDLILDTNNDIKIMEWNGGHNDIKFSEAIQGPIFLGLGLEKLWQSKL